MPIDMTGITAEKGNTGFRPLVPGVYEAVIDQANLGTTASGKNQGKPKIDLRLVAVGTDNWLFRSYSLTPENLKYLKADLVDMGFPEDKMNPLDEAELIGLHAWCVVSVKDDYKGRRDAQGNVYQENEVDRIIPADEVEAEKAKFAARASQPAAELPQGVQNSGSGNGGFGW